MTIPRKKKKKSKKINKKPASSYSISISSVKDKSSDMKICNTGHITQYSLYFEDLLMPARSG